jgi:VIT1/CCC1 family predicted Fe2+/Mn2+ transporter
VAIIVIVSTLPVVIPFMVFSNVKVALQVSNGLPLGKHFLGGWIFGRYGHGNPRRDGLKMVAVGAVLVAAIIVLGG